MIHAGPLIHFPNLVWTVYWGKGCWSYNVQVADGFTLSPALGAVCFCSHLWHCMVGQNPSQTCLTLTGAPSCYPSTNNPPHCTCVLCRPGASTSTRLLPADQVVSKKIQGYFHLVNRKHGAAHLTVYCSLFRLFISTLLKCKCNPRPLN